MIHPIVDIGRWKQRWPLDQYLAAMDARYHEILNDSQYLQRGHPSDFGPAPSWYYYAPNSISTPLQLAIAEQMRLQSGDIPWQEGEPVDVLLPALGEPPRREVSKIGGLPYRPRKAWPVDKYGDPLSFIGQFCFADSLDLLKPRGLNALPGDVLLIFQETDELIFDEGTGAPVLFEWCRVGMDKDTLITPIDVPKQRVSFEPTYFERHRSVDFHTTPVVAREIDERGQFVDKFWSSKIGGLPAWQQEERDDLGTFLCALHAVQPDEREFPFPNVPVSPWGRWPSTDRFFMLGDVGTLYFFWDGERVRWTMQCG